MLYSSLPLSLPLSRSPYRVHEIFKHTCSNEVLMNTGAPSRSLSKTGTILLKNCG